MKYLIFILLMWGLPTSGEMIRTENFVISASSPQLAADIASKVELHRQLIAMSFLGYELPKWNTPCLITAAETNNSWGWTYYTWQTFHGITLNGPAENIMKHSLPHEIAHTIINTHFNRRMPKFFDEGIAVAAELDCPTRLGNRWGNQKLCDLFRTNYYPEDWKSFYAQSYSVTMFLFCTYGREKVFEFVTGEDGASWEEATVRVFGVDLETLEKDWRVWHAARFGGD